MSENTENACYNMLNLKVTNLLFLSINSSKPKDIRLTFTEDKDIWLIMTKVKLKLGTIWHF